VLERETVIIDDVWFAGATLWTDYDRANPMSMIEISAYINDYMTIRFAHKHKMTEMRKLKPEDLLADHDATKTWLSQALPVLRTQCRKVVLITHHGISHQSIGEKYKTSPINGAFVSNLEHFLDVAPPDLAIHGHVHNSCDYQIDNAVQTRVIANPRGYAKNNLSQGNRAFDPCFVVDI